MKFCLFSSTGYIVPLLVSNFSLKGWSQTWDNDHLRIATTWPQRPPFWSPNVGLYNIKLPLNNDHLSTTAEVPRVVVRCTQVWMNVIKKREFKKSSIICWWEKVFQDWVKKISKWLHLKHFCGCVNIILLFGIYSLDLNLVFSSYVITTTVKLSLNHHLKIFCSTTKFKKLFWRIFCSTHDFSRHTTFIPLFRIST